MTAPARPGGRDTSVEAHRPIRIVASAWPGRYPAAGGQSGRGGAMYLSHFDLREPPFAMTPDPRFLYLSAQHREALAHLVYGVTAHGGFVQLTGEVGTGKTSVCRCLLDQLPPHVDVALVLNPRLSAVELLATLCDELRIARPRDACSVKALVDLLGRHLLDAHARGRRPVLIVDEAQGLAPDVLEQVRLLTNLETTQEKLLQVILIGQPELAALLAQPGLRQVAQRITARYHLGPLSRLETAAYVQHRLQVAGRRPALFTPGALRLVHGRAGGVPRLINAICDRALLGAYAAGRARIDRGTVRRAARELFGPRPAARRRWRALGAGAAGAVAAGLFLVLLTPSRTARNPGDEAGLGPGGAGGQAAAVPVAVDEAAPPGRPAARALSLDALLADPAVAVRRSEAVAAVLRQWGMEAGLAPDCGGPLPGGLKCLALVGSWRKLRRIDLPAVLELAGPGGERRYAALTGLAGSQVTLRLGGRVVSASVAEIESHWDGAFLLLWTPPDVALPLVPGSQGAGVDWLRERLGAAGGGSSPPARGRPYDGTLRARVAAFQRAHGLDPDGVVGRETALVLATAGVAGVPRLADATP
jgi:general secretion pathway protein A